MSHRFYCPDPARDGRLHLQGDEARHLTRVCRLAVGDLVEVFDGMGWANKAEIVAIELGHVDLALIGPALEGPLPPFCLTLASAVPKGERFDWLVEKATELGAWRLIPILTERSVVEPRPAKLERLRRTIIEASKQCGRNRLMILERPARWPELAAGDSEAIRFLADPAGLTSEHWPTFPTGSSVTLAVGPEGGFTPSEKALADRLGWTTIRLSSNTLRTETAALAACAIFLARPSGASKEGFQIPDSRFQIQHGGESSV